MHPTLLPLLMTILLWASTLTFGFLACIWSAKTWANVILRLWFVALALLGIACIFKTYLS